MLWAQSFRTSRMRHADNRDNVKLLGAGKKRHQETRGVTTVLQKSAHLPHKRWVNTRWLAGTTDNKGTEYVSADPLGMVV